MKFREVCDIEQKPHSCMKLTPHDGCDQTGHQPSGGRANDDQRLHIVDVQPPPTGMIGEQACGSPIEQKGDGCDQTGHEPCGEQSERLCSPLTPSTISKNSGAWR